VAEPAAPLDGDAKMTGHWWGSPAFSLVPLAVPGEHRTGQTEPKRKHSAAAVIINTPEIPRGVRLDSQTGATIARASSAAMRGIWPRGGCRIAREHQPSVSGSASPAKLAACTSNCVTFYAGPTCTLRRVAVTA
jgi:hypothetical protein